VSLVTKYVTGDFLQLTFNDVGRGGGGQKVLSKPSADSFAVGRKQKEEYRIWSFNISILPNINIDADIEITHSLTEKPQNSLLGRQGVQCINMM
jgi:hypothetical protein